MSAELSRTINVRLRDFVLRSPDGQERVIPRIIEIETRRWDDGHIRCQVQTHDVDAALALETGTAGYLEARLGEDKAGRLPFGHFKVERSPLISGGAKRFTVATICLIEDVCGKYRLYIADEATEKPMEMEVVISDPIFTPPSD